MAASNPDCVCGDPKSAQRLGRKGCKELDCGCDKFESVEDQAETERVLTVVAEVCEDRAARAARARGELAEMRVREAGHTGPLPEVPAEMYAPDAQPLPEPEPVDEQECCVGRPAYGIPNAIHMFRAPAEPVVAEVPAEPDPHDDEIGRLRDQLRSVADTLTRRTRQRDAAHAKADRFVAELARVREQLADAHADCARAETALAAEPAADVLGHYDARACPDCAAGEPVANHTCGPLLPVTVTITVRQEA